MTQRFQNILKQNYQMLLKNAKTLEFLRGNVSHLANNDYCICCRPKGPTGAGFKGWAKVDPNAAAEESDRKAVPDRLFEVDGVTLF